MMRRLRKSYLFGAICSLITLLFGVALVIAGIGNEGMEFTRTPPPPDIDYGILYMCLEPSPPPLTFAIGVATFIGGACGLMNTLTHPEATYEDR
jgi:hypothetical protein